jgi:hypothetical protein
MHSVVMLDPARHEPGSARLDRFLNDLPSEATKKHPLEWKKWPSHSVGLVRQGGECQARLG